MKLNGRIAVAGAVAALLAAGFASAQDGAVTPFMQAQVRSAASAEMANSNDEPLPGVGELDHEGGIGLAAWLQQPANVPTLATNQPTVRRAATASRLASTSLA